MIQLTDAYELIIGSSIDPQFGPVVLSERENGELLILMRIPIFLGQHQDTPYNTIPLGIILNDQFVITVCKPENDILQELISGRVRSLATGKRNRFILRILLNTANKYLVYLREINKTVEAIEDKLQLSTRNKEVLELLMYQKSLTYFTTALKANELMLEPAPQPVLPHLS